MLRQVGFLQAAVVQLQGIATREPAELIDGHTDLGRNGLEEIFHFPATGLGEVTKLVLHILEDVSHFFGGDAYGVGAIGQALECFCRSIGKRGKSLNLLGVVGHFFSDATELADGAGYGKSCNACANDFANTVPGGLNVLGVLVQVALHVTRFAICHSLCIGHALDKATDLCDQFNSEGAKLTRHLYALAFFAG